MMSSAKEQLIAAESQLRTAMLTSDVERLDALLADDLVFTDHNGRRLTKAQDLAAHAGNLKITRIDVQVLKIRPSGTCAVVTLTADIRGSFHGVLFSERLAYTRIWEQVNENWKVFAAHCSVGA